MNQSNKASNINSIIMLSKYDAQIKVEGENCYEYYTSSSLKSLKELWIQVDQIQTLWETGSGSKLVPSELIWLTNQIRNRLKSFNTNVYWPKSF